MQHKTDTGTSLVSKSTPVANSNSVNRLFAARKEGHKVRQVQCRAFLDAEDARNLLQNKGRIVFTDFVITVLLGRLYL